MEKQKVSVIVAVYNVENYLDECLYSICSQTYQNLQIILVNDGSTDNSGVICDLWRDKDERITTCHQKNSGVSMARNAAIEAVEGDFLVFVDSDDNIEPDFVSTLLEAYTDRDLTVAGYYIDCIRNGKVSSTVKVYGNKVRKDQHIKMQANGVAELFASGMFSVVWNKIYNVSVIRKHGISFQNDLNLGEDVIFNLSYMKALEGGFNVVSYPVYHYMKRGTESLDHKYNENFANTQKLIFQSLLNYLKVIRSPFEKEEIIYRLYFNALVVAIDNLYQNKRSLPKSEFNEKMLERKKDPEFEKIIEKLSGIHRFVSKLRWKLILHGLFPLDYYVRFILKKVSGLE